MLITIKVSRVKKVMLQRKLPNGYTIHFPAPGRQEKEKHQLIDIT